MHKTKYSIKIATRTNMTTQWDKIATKIATMKLQVKNVPNEKAEDLVEKIEASKRVMKEKHELSLTNVQ